MMPEPVPRSSRHAPGLDQRQRGVNEGFGVGAGIEHVGRQPEAAAIEVAGAEDARNGFMGESPRHECLELLPAPAQRECDPARR